MASKGLAALAPHGLKSSGYTVSNYPRDNLTAGTRAILDSLAANPTTANIGVKSGYRDPARNAKAGGAKRSQHMKGNAVDLDISGLSNAQKQAVLDTAIAAGAKGIGVYASENSLHVDPRANPTVWGQLSNTYKGMTKKQFSLLPDWARPAIDALFGGFNPQPNPNLPDVMTPPQTKAQALFAAPSRPQAINPPARLAPVPAGTVTRAPLSAIPAALTPAPVGRVERAPLGPVGQFTGPARSLAHPVSAPAPSQLAAAPAGQVTKGPALAPATPNAQTLAAQYGQYRPSTVTQMPTVVGMPSIPAPTGLPAAKPVAQPLAHPVSVPAIAQPVAPAPVLAPALAPPRAIQDRPIAEMAAPPRATAYDVYNGLAETALDNTGQNTVGRLPDGTTTVTNKYGVTTGMTPYGKQTAVGALPGITGPVSKAVKGAVPAIGGSLLGGFLGGPAGALLGAALMKEVAKPGGLLSGQNNFATNWFGNITTNKPQGGLGFPDAPSGGYGSGGRMGASYSNRSRADMDSISPGASKAIGAGKGGLY